MKIALAQLNYHIGNFDFNSAKIIDAIQKASAQGCDLIVFAELSVCGYPPLDFLDYKDFGALHLLCIIRNYLFNVYLDKKINRCSAP